MTSSWLFWNLFYGRNSIVLRLIHHTVLFKTMWKNRRNIIWIRSIYHFKSSVFNFNIKLLVKKQKKINNLKIIHSWNKMTQFAHSVTSVKSWFIAYYFKSFNMINMFKKYRIENEVWIQFFTYKSFVDWQDIFLQSFILWNCALRSQKFFPLIIKLL